MNLFRVIWSRFRSLWQGRAVKQEIDEELRFHLEQRTSENIANGMSAEEAAREARKRFGNFQSVREECRAARGATFAEGILCDLRLGLRMLRKNLGFTTVAGLTLALGIGANTTIFSVFKTLVLNPLPFPHPNRLVQVCGVASRRLGIGGHTPVLASDYLDIRKHCHSLCEFGAFNKWGFVLGGNTPKMVVGLMCTASLGQLLGMRPALGRWFTKDEEQPGAPRVAVISHALWEQRFGGNPKILGRKIKLTDGYGLDHEFTIIGVLPVGEDFSPICTSDVFIPLTLDKLDAARLRHRIVGVLARLAPGVTMRAASTELTVLGTRLARAYPAGGYRVSLCLIPLKQQLVGDMTVPLMLMQGAVLLVLLLACANVAGMLLARTTGRQTEIAVRTALGAGRRHILRLMLAESFMISLLAAALGLLLAVWGMNVLGHLAPAGILMRGRFHLDGPVLAFALTLAALATVLSGIPPTLAAAKIDMLSALKEGGPQHSVSRTQMRQFRRLVIAQVALSLMLINVALLLTVSYRKMVQDSRSFITDQIVTGWVNLLGHPAYGKIQAQQALRDSLLDNIRALPGVKAAGATTQLPFGECRSWPILVAGESYDPNVPRLRAEVSCITTGYCQAIGMKILKGRMVTAAEAQAKPEGILVNRTFAEHYWGKGNPIGGSVRDNSPKPDFRAQVDGVVEDVRQNPEKPAMPEIYIFNSAEVADEHGFEIAVRTSGDALRLVPALRQTLARLDPSLTLADVQTMTEVFDDSTNVQRFQMLLIDAFMAVALLLTAVGIYGSMAFYVAGRTREIGLRMALGATRKDIMALIASQVALWLTAGAILGLGMALGAGILLRSMFYGTSPTSPFCLAGSLAVVVLATLVGCWLPARRATRIDPMTALRCE